MKSLSKNTELYKQIKFYICNEFDIEPNKLKDVAIDEHQIRYKNNKSSHKKIDIPFEEWKHEQPTTLYIEYNKYISKIDRLTDIIYNICSDFNEKYVDKHISFDFHITNENLVITGIYEKTKFKQQKVVNLNNHINNKNEIQLKQNFKNYFINVSQVFDKYLKGQKYIEEHKYDLLEEFIMDLTTVMSSSLYLNSKNELYIKIYNEKFILDKNIFIDLIYDLDYEFYYRDGNIVNIKIIPEGRHSFIEKAKIVLQKEMIYNLEDYPNIKQATIYCDNYNLKYINDIYSGIKYNSIQNSKTFSINYEMGVFILSIETDFGRVVYRNNNFVIELKEQDVKNVLLFSDEYKEAFKFINKTFSKIIDKLEFVSGKGLIYGDTFLLLKKDKPSLFAVKIDSCRNLSKWKKSIQNYAKQIKLALDNDNSIDLYTPSACSKIGVFGDTTMNFGLRFVILKDYYGNFLAQDIISLIEINENITQDNIIKNLRGLKCTEINNIEHSGYYKDFTNENILNLLNDFVDKKFISFNNENQTYKINQNAKLLFCGEVFVSYLKKIFEQNDLNCLELEYLMNKKDKTSEEWIWYLSGFNNKEFLCVYKDEVINSWSNADYMLLSLLEMRFNNNEFNNKIAIKVITEILNKNKNTL